MKNQKKLKKYISIIIYLISIISYILLLKYTLININNYNYVIIKFNTGKVINYNHIYITSMYIILSLYYFINYFIKFNNKYLKMILYSFCLVLSIISLSKYYTSQHFINLFIGTIFNLMVLIIFYTRIAKDKKETLYFK